MNHDRIDSKTMQDARDFLKNPSEPNVRECRVVASLSEEPPSVGSPSEEDKPDVHPFPSPTSSQPENPDSKLDTEKIGESRTSRFTLKFWAAAASLLLLANLGALLFLGFFGPKEPSGGSQMVVEATPLEKLTAEAAQASRALGSDPRELARRVAALSPSEYREGAEQLAEAGLTLDDPAFALLLGLWGEVAPADALAFTLEGAPGTLLEHRFESRRGLVHDWGRRDSESALAWISERNPGPLVHWDRLQVVAGAPLDAAPLITDSLRSLEAGPERAEATRELAERLINEDGSEALKDWAAGLWPRELYTAGALGTTGQLLAQENPAEAQKWAQSLQSNVAGPAYAAVAYELAQENPEEAAEWVEELVAADQKDGALEVDPLGAPVLGDAVSIVETATGEPIQPELSEGPETTRGTNFEWNQETRAFVDESGADYHTRIIETPEGDQKFVYVSNESRVAYDLEGNEIVFSGADGLSGAGPFLDYGTIASSSLIDYNNEPKVFAYDAVGRIYDQHGYEYNPSAYEVSTSGRLYDSRSRAPVVFEGEGDAARFPWENQPVPPMRTGTVEDDAMIPVDVAESIDPEAVIPPAITGPEAIEALIRNF